MNVLVVDDNQFNLELVKLYLESIHAITNIVLCEDPRKAKALLDENEIDILIMDIVMPMLSGLDVLTLLRTDPKYDDLAIIMLSTLDDLESYKKCFDLGAFDYINKPINKVELYARLKVAIEWKNNTKYLKSLIEITLQQNEEFKEMNAKLTEAKFSLVQSEKMAAIGQLAAGIAHEINNPLGFVNSNIDTLQSYFKRIVEFLNSVSPFFQEDQFLMNEELTKHTTDIEAKYKKLKIDLIMKELDDIFTDSLAGIRRITEIVQSLRVFARSTADDEKNSNVLIDLIQQVLLITKSEVKFISNVELDVPDDIIIFCNRVQISQVFVNILINAAQAIKSQNREELGLIHISARKVKQEVMIKFADDGPGIPEQNLSKIFEPFFTTKEIGQGTGLGLSISYDIIVNKHKGRISVKSETGKGAIFTIILPIVSAD